MAKRTTTDRGRYYTDSQGQQYHSVTTLLKQGVPKEALIQWSGNESAKYVIDELGRTLEATFKLLQDVSTAANGSLANNPDLWKRVNAAAAGFSNRDRLLGMLSSGVASDAESAYDDIRKANIRTRDNAGRAGSMAHKMIEEYILAKQTDPDATLENSNRDDVDQMIDRFRDFEREYEPRWEASELIVFNATAGYAGTLDFIAEIPKLGPGLTLGDFKTGRGVFPEVALQLAAYRHAEFAESAYGNVVVDMPKTERAVVIHMRPDDPNSYQDKHPESYYEVIPMETGDEVFEMFKFVSQVAWFTRNGEEWQGEPVEST